VHHSLYNFSKWGIIDTVMMEANNVQMNGDFRLKNAISVGFSTSFSCNFSGARLLFFDFLCHLYSSS